jgi:hypothetical protein
MLDKLAGLGGVMGMVPGANMLGLVFKGLELMKGLLESKDLKGAEQVLNMLSKFMKEAGPQEGTTPGEAQAATLPQMPPGTTMEIEMRISSPGSGKAVPREAMRETDGTPAGDQRYTEQMGQFMEGSAANKGRVQPGTEEWKTVAGAMYSNPNVHYNADTQRFFAKTEGGGKVDLGSLQEMKKFMDDNGGYDRNNPTVLGKVGAMIADKLQQAQESPAVSTIIYRVTTQAAKGAEAEGQVEAPSEEQDKRIAEFKAKLDAYREAAMLMQSQSISYTQVGVSASA